LTRSVGCCCWRGLLLSGRRCRRRRSSSLLRCCCNDAAERDGRIVGLEVIVVCVVCKGVWCG